VELKLSLSDNTEIYILLHFLFQVKFSQYLIKGSGVVGRVASTWHYLCQVMPTKYNTVIESINLFLHV
jgi:hypothetical protein